jgi:hypothetical protein
MQTIATRKDLYKLLNRKFTILEKMYICILSKYHVIRLTLYRFFMGKRKFDAYINKKQEDMMLYIMSLQEQFNFNHEKEQSN